MQRIWAKRTYSRIQLVFDVFKERVMMNEVSAVHVVVFFWGRICKLALFVGLLEREREET